MKEEINSKLKYMLRICNFKHLNHCIAMLNNDLALDLKRFPFSEWNLSFEKLPLINGEEVHFLRVIQSDEGEFYFSNHNNVKIKESDFDEETVKNLYDFLDQLIVLK